MRKSATHTVADLVSLIRYSTGLDNELIPYGDRVREKYAAWLAQQEQAGVTFTETEQVVVGSHGVGDRGRLQVFASRIWTRRRSPNVVEPTEP